MPSAQPFQNNSLRPIDRMTVNDLVLLGGYSEDDPIVDVLQHLFAALESGVISIDLTLIAAESNPAVDQFLTHCKQGDYDTVAGWAPDVDKPLVLVESAGTYRLYFQKYYYHEVRLKRQIKSFESTPATPIVENSGRLLERLYEPQRALRKDPQKSPLAKDEHQVSAIEQALTSPLTIISGGPGTGKTTIVANLLRCLAECKVAPERILLTAPTGRAAQRITETMKALMQSILAPTPGEVALQTLQAQTLHTALGYQHPGQFHFSSNNPLPKDAVIVDEASMVDVVLMSQFLSALEPSTTRLVLLGDPDQLPAVAAGSIFTRLTSFKQDATHTSGSHVVLEQGYRSGSDLTRLAQQIRQGTFPDHQPETISAAFFSEPFKPWCRLVPFDLKSWPRVLKTWARFYQAAFDQTSLTALNYLRQRSVAAFSQPDPVLLEMTTKLLMSATIARILTLVRKGPWGCEDINDFLKPLVANGLDQGGHPETGVFAGMPIMITRNDRDNGLYNGDVGVVVALKDGYYSIFQTSDRYAALPMSQLTAWEPAMAITVHKSQGSEYKQVLLVLPDDPSHRLLSREMVYTAVTRAQEQLVIWSDEYVLQSAMAKKAIESVGPLF